MKFYEIHFQTILFSFYYQSYVIIVWHFFVICIVTSDYVCKDFLIRKYCFKCLYIVWFCYSGSFFQQSDYVAKVQCLVRLNLNAINILIFSKQHKLSFTTYMYKGSCLIQALFHQHINLCTYTVVCRTVPFCICLLFFCFSAIFSKDM